MYPLIAKIPVLFYTEEGYKLSKLIGSEEIDTEHKEFNVVEFNLNSIIFYDVDKDNPEHTFILTPGSSFVVGVSLKEFKKIRERAIIEMEVFLASIEIVEDESED